MNGRIICITILIFCSVKIFSQEVIEIINYHPGSKLIKEKYTVLKSDKKTKQGSYISFHRDYLYKRDSLIFEEGQFENGLRSGYWKRYKRPTIKGNVSSWGKLEMTGEYKNGEKAGIWKIYKEDGAIIESYDFDNMKVIEYSLADLIYLYPTMAQADRIEGEVTVEYQLDARCTFIGMSIVKSLSKDTDKQCLEILTERFRLIKKYNIPFDKCDGNKHTETFTYKL